MRNGMRFATRSSDATVLQSRLFDRYRFNGGQPPAIRMQTSDFSIQLANVRRHFIEGGRTKTVLDGVSLSVRSGESVAIRGRSGSGKSTLLNLVAAIDTPDSGAISVCGHRLTDLSERDRTLFRRANVGFVYQSFHLIPTLNVANNIRLVLELGGLRGREVATRIAELLDAVGLADRGASFPDTLSGGEQQRVAVARALANRPGVLIADEPTGNLDDANAEVVMQLLESLVRDQGATMLIATHSARAASRCDRVVELSGGVVLETARQ